MTSTVLQTGRGPVVFSYQGESAFEGEDIAGTVAVGRASCWRVTYRTAVIDMFRIDWSTGLSDIRAGDVHAGQEPVKSLARGRLRLGIASLAQSEVATAIDDASLYGARFCWSELRVAAVKPGSQGWSNLVNADLPLLKAVTGSDPVGLFMGMAGVAAFGTKAERLGRTDNTRNRLCIVFRRDAQLPPLAAFACTRLMPLEDA